MTSAQEIQKTSAQEEHKLDAIEDNETLDALMIVLRVHLKDLHLIDMYTNELTPRVDGRTVRGCLAYLYKRMAENRTLE